MLTSRFYSHLSGSSTLCTRGATPFPSLVLHAIIRSIFRQAALQVTYIATVVKTVVKVKSLTDHFQSRPGQ